MPDAVIAWIRIPALNAVATDWAARVVTNGGAAPSAGSTQALSDFWDAVEAAGIDSKMIAVNCYAPDNLIASITPLYKTFGNDPWTNTGPFVGGDLTVGGLAGNGTSKYLQTGVIPSTAYPNTNSVGLTAYSVTASDAITPTEIGCASGGSNTLRLYYCYSGTTYFDAWNTTNGRTNAANSLWSGFLSANRTAANAASIYRANSGVSFNTLVSSSTTNTGGLSTQQLYAHATNEVGVASNFSIRRISFIAFHLGLTSGESQSFYDAIQAMRVALGGGYV